MNINLGTRPLSGGVRVHLALGGGWGGGVRGGGGVATYWRERDRK